MEDVETVEITDSLADLSQEVNTGSFCQCETFLGNSVKQLSALQVLHQQDCLGPGAVAPLISDYFPVI